MAKKALKAQLYDKPRYAFDEEQLFHHFDTEKQREEFETKTFPWWKPVFMCDHNRWSLQRADGAYFHFNEFDAQSHHGIFPNFHYKLVEAAKYAWSPVFFVHWMKSVTYDRSICHWLDNEKKFKKEFPDKRPDQIARMCDDFVAKWFESLKNCSTEQFDKFENFARW